MKQSLNGILISKKDYSETSLILKFYTLEEGLQAYIFQGGKKKKGNMLMPLSLMEIEVYKRPESNLGKISSINASYVYQQVQYDPIKSTVFFFMAEVLSLTLKSSENEENLFAFLKQEIIWADQTDELTNYPIYFLCALSRYLGFYPHTAVDSPSYFDLEEGELTVGKPVGHKYLSDKTVTYLNKIIAFNKAEALSYPIPKEVRKKLLSNLILYFRYHVEHFRALKTLEIIEEILS